jgi:hypothetical protein
MPEHDKWILFKLQITYITNFIIGTLKISKYLFRDALYRIIDVLGESVLSHWIKRPTANQAQPWVKGEGANLRG